MKRSLEHIQIDKIEFSFLNSNLMVPAGHQPIFICSRVVRTARSKLAQLWSV